MANKTMMCQILSYVASNLILKSQDSKFDIRKIELLTQHNCKNVVDISFLF